MAKADILVVDDHPLNLKLLTTILASAGYATRTAAAADEALAAIEEASPDLILMDIQLPEMDGLELTRRLRADPVTAETVIVAVTSYAMVGDAERALAAGCDGYLTKPIDTRGLIQYIEDYLSRRRAGTDSRTG